jgi:hypothetical protein
MYCFPHTHDRHVPIYELDPHRVPLDSDSPHIYTFLVSFCPFLARRCFINSGQNSYACVYACLRVPRDINRYIRPINTYTGRRTRSPSQIHRFPRPQPGGHPRDDRRRHSCLRHRYRTHPVR